MSDGDAFQWAKRFNFGLSFVHLIQCFTTVVLFMANIVRFIQISTDGREVTMVMTPSWWSL